MAEAPHKTPRATSHRFGSTSVGRTPIDVITVPDFSGAGAAVFEARTLVFLSSWLEHAGDARAWPLHLACIGEPPPSVRRLAERCGASITVHAPMKLRHDHHVGNKFRGLEIEPQTDRFLLLDVDIAFLGDISPLADLGTCVAASPDDAPNVPRIDWQRIFSAFSLPMPSPIRPLTRELDLPWWPQGMTGFEAGDDQIDAMLPYYNGGVVFAPWSCDLRDRWGENVLRIASLFAEEQPTRKWIHHSDQAALAVTITQLERDGCRFVRLPDSANARWQHLYAGTPDPADIAILHCCWNFLSSIGPGPVTLERLSESLRQFFHSKVRHRCQKLAFCDCLRLRPLTASRRLAAAARRATEICTLLERGCRAHLAGLMPERHPPVG